MAGKFAKFPNIFLLTPSFVFCVVFKDHIVKSAAGHFALKRLINQDKERLQSGNTGKPQEICRV